MGSKNIFTGKPQGAERKAPREPIARILSRAEASNPLPHQSGPRNFSGLGGGRRSGPLCGRRTRREQARRGSLFGIKDGIH